MLQVLSYYAFWEYSFYAKIFTYYASPLTHYARIMLDLKLKKQMSYQLRSTQETKKLFDKGNFSMYTETSA